MPTFVPGQRWISETEPDLGLGMVLTYEANRVTILFIAAGERRTYAAGNAPLARVKFAVGDTIEDVDGAKLIVESLKEQAGIITYHAKSAAGEAVALPEAELNHFLQFNRPQDRLFTGQIDSASSFRLRQETQRLMARLEADPTRGLAGGRTSLIPHQLYIASEVARRVAPRVLLADEVGLGKTIEAGLIIHQQLLTGRVARVLLLVPETLLHQWLVEMRRRFNLRFSLFDEDRLLESGEEENPFAGEQLVLCGLDLLAEDDKWADAAEAAGWDLIVVDEAHHLEWSEDDPSLQYQVVERLGQKVPGLLLLTATPEQLGKAGHYARLRLLDPARFHSFAKFQEEERHYGELADAIKHLLDDAVLDVEQLAHLKTLLADDVADELLGAVQDPARTESVRQELIQLLLDRHGTGRVLFRNTRAAVKGFPGRELLATPLPLPEAYRGVAADADDALESGLHPEDRYRQENPEAEPWWRFDPRVDWLTTTVKGLRPAKVLVICAHADTAIDLEEALRVAGITNAAFHERLSIVARDRAAAWFADAEEGAQALVCSEIGSEGRNFQFAHHLVLFDLPLNPDLLEQRIGRLDRIGQTETIRLHVAYFEDSPQATLFRWYRDALNAFSRPCPAAPGVNAQLGERLRAILAAPDAQAEAALLSEARALTEATEQVLHDGRDRLLELNSCRTEDAARVLAQIAQVEDELPLWDYFERVLDNFGVNVEEHSDHCYILAPGEHLQVQFPEVPDDGVTITLDRGIALAREDMLFLTYEHPMVRGAIDMVINGEHGNAAISMVEHDDLDPGQLLLEAIYRVECVAPKALHINRFFPNSLHRLVFDQAGNDVSVLTAESFAEQPHQFDREHAAELVQGQRELVLGLLAVAERQAQAKLPGIIGDAGKRMLDTMTSELKRLAALKKVNPNVRQEELDEMKRQALEMNTCIKGARIRLDAVRLLVVV